MVRVVYPDGHEVNFMWIKGDFGFIRQGRCILRYPLPTENQNELEPIGEDM